MTKRPRVSEMAENLVGSEIIKLAGEIKQRIASGAKIHNLTIGDFNPEIFPIPQELLDLILQAFKNGHTNYPTSNGVIELREALCEFIGLRQGIELSANQVLVAGGARPLIYATYRAIINQGEKVIFPTPSWNNNHYTHLSDGQKMAVGTKPENNFMPVAEDIRPGLAEAGLVALCSPLNPTGTVFSEDQLREICEAIVEENERRGADAKPVYLLYDQIYWQLTFDGIRHTHPLEVCPEIRPYAIYIDGMSKAFAATGVRVGWAFGPQEVLDKMKSILGHVGAWAPKAEQIATAQFLKLPEAVDQYLEAFRDEIHQRLAGLYNGFKKLSNAGHDIHAIAPQAAIYLTVQFNLIGKKCADGSKIERAEDVTSFLLDEAGLGVVPFTAFGSDKGSTWYRISVGTLHKEDIPDLIEKLEKALQQLH